MPCIFVLAGAGNPRLFYCIPVHKYSRLYRTVLRILARTGAKTGSHRGTLANGPKPLAWSITLPPGADGPDRMRGSSLRKRMSPTRTSGPASRKSPGGFSSLPSAEASSYPADSIHFDPNPPHYPLTGLTFFMASDDTADRRRPKIKFPPFPSSRRSNQRRRLNYGIHHNDFPRPHRVTRRR